MMRMECVSSLPLQVFCEVAYRAVSVQNIVDGIDEFLDELIVLPPSIWDQNMRLEPPLTTRSKVLTPLRCLFLSVCLSVVLILVSSSASAVF